MVDISTEALKNVKSALTTFQTDIDGISFRSTNDSDEISDSCKAYIGQTKAEIVQSETKISDLNKQILSLEEKISQATSEYNALLLRKPQIENNIRSLNARISSLNAQISSLRSQLADTEDEDEKQQIQEQINKLNSQVSQCENKRNQLEDELRNSEQKKEELQQTINSAKSQKSKCESELSIEKNRCNRLKDKLERLNSTFSRIENDLNAYVEATKKFENNSSNRALENKTSIDKCMQCIEEYLSVSL